MKKRDFGEMVAYFNSRVADMDIAQKYKMELLGMITAIQMEHDAERTAKVGKEGINYYCTGCGKWVYALSHYCNYCGARLEWE